METAVDNPTIFNGDKSKKPRQGSQMYIPVHRRATGDESSGEPSPRTPRTPRTPTTGSQDPKSSQDSYFEGNPEVSSSARRGRGRFRAPGKPGGSSGGGSSDSNGADPQEHAPKGRDFDATSLRTYNDLSNRGKPKKGGRGRGGRRTGASGEGKGGGRAGGEDGTEEEAQEEEEEEEYNEEEPTDSSVPGTPVAGGFPRANGRALGVVTAAEKDLIDLGGEAIAAQDQEALDKLTDAMKTMGMSPQNESPIESPKEEWEDILNAPDIDILSTRQASFVGDEDGDQDGPTPSSSKSFSKKKRRSSRIEAPIEVITEPPSPDEPTVILDCYDFPASFKTHHLHDIFREYESMRGGYRIKWLEDTRALIMFEHPATAKKAYLDNVTNPLAKIRPYNGPLSGKRSSSPPPRRPTTTDMVAKRLVHGALGVKVAKSPEQKIAEKQMLQAARDEREAKRTEAVRRVQDLDAAFNE